jgi:hypothetical protein
MTPQMYWDSASWQMKDNMLENYAEEGGYRHDRYLFWSFDLLPFYVKIIIANAVRYDMVN